MTPEEEYKRGLRLIARNRSDLAKVRFDRAEKGGINVFARLIQEQALPKEHFGQTKKAPESDRAGELFKALVDAKPTDFEKGKGWKPEVSKRNLIEDQRPMIEATSAVTGIDGPSPTPSGFPPGTMGAVMVFIGGAWTALAAPAPPANHDFDPVLRHNGVSPYWYTPVECP